MKATDEKKVDIAKDILVAYIANSPPESKDLDSVIAATKKIFEMVDSLVQSQEAPKGSPGFRL
jgi:predicted transcriptional regulator